MYVDDTDLCQRPLSATICRASGCYAMAKPLPHFKGAKTKPPRYTVYAVFVKEAGGATCAGRPRGRLVRKRRR